MTDVPRPDLEAIQAIYDDRDFAVLSDIPALLAYVRDLERRLAEAVGTLPSPPLGR